MVVQGLVSCECCGSVDSQGTVGAVVSDWGRRLVEIMRGRAVAGAGERKQSSVNLRFLRSATSCEVKLSLCSTAASSNLRCGSSGLLSTEAKT
jgi:hypothetical protein